MKKNDSSLFGYNSDDIRSGAVKSPETEQKKNGKAGGRLVYAAAVAVTSVLLAVILIIAAVNRFNTAMIMELEPGEMALSMLEDGEYTGMYTAANMGAQVTVKVTAGSIISINLDAFAKIDTSRAEKVFDAVIRAQSLATYDDEVGTEPTDIILLLAIQNAIEGGYAQ